VNTIEDVVRVTPPGHTGWVAPDATPDLQHPVMIRDHNNTLVAWFRMPYQATSVTLGVQAVVWCQMLDGEFDGFDSIMEALVDVGRRCLPVARTAPLPRQESWYDARQRARLAGPPPRPDVVMEQGEQDRYGWRPETIEGWTQWVTAGSPGSEPGRKKPMRYYGTEQIAEEIATSARTVRQVYNRYRDRTPRFPVPDVVIGQSEGKGWPGWSPRRVPQVQRFVAGHTRGVQDAPQHTDEDVVRIYDEVRSWRKLAEALGMKSHEGARRRYLRAREALASVG
jgi:hypothetical protein